MRPFVAAAMALLLALIAFAPAAGASAEVAMRGFGGETMGTVIVIASFDVGDTASAQVAMRMLDDRMIEESFGGFVVESEPLTPSMLRGVGADDGAMFAMVMDDLAPAILIVIRVDSTVYMLVQSGDTLDGELMAGMTRNVAQDGLDAVIAPYGYVEMPIDGSDTVGSPFDGLTEEGI